MADRLPADLQSTLRDLADELKRIPEIQNGTFYFSVLGWTEVHFDEPFSEPPNVVAMIEAPKGLPSEEWPYPPPDVLVEIVKLATISRLEEVTIEAIDIPDLERITVVYEGREITYREWVVEEVTNDIMEILNAGKWVFNVLGVLLDLVDIKETIRKVIRRTVEIVVDLMIRLIKKYVIPYFQLVLNHARDSIEAAVQDLRDRANKALDEFRTNIQNAFNKFGDNLEVNFSEVTKYITDAYNRSIDKLYEYLNIEKGNVMIPALIEQGSVTNVRFKVWSPGYGTLHWIALGKRPKRWQSLIEEIETIVSEV